jgi:hypothetical protein
MTVTRLSIQPEHVCDQSGGTYPAAPDLEHPVVIAASKLDACKSPIRVRWQDFLGVSSKP